MNLLQRIRKHYLVDIFLGLKGNPKYCIYTEPLWFIPYSLYMPYATLYMYQLGVSDAQIGMILGLGMVMQVIASFMGGVLTDKYGRRWTTVVFDVISWSIPCLIWAFAQNYWWFVIAVILNSMWQITNNSWGCLLVEDCDKKHIVTLYSYIQICSLLSVFVAPISALLVDNFDLLLVMRGLYLLSFVSMTVKFLILFFAGHETERGKQRMAETKDIPMIQMFGGYKDVFLKLIRSRQMLLVLALMLSYSISNTVTQNFFSLYVTQDLHLAEKYLAVFPMIRSVIMLLFIILVQAKLNQLPYRPVMIMGYSLFIAAHVLLVVAPPESLWMVVLYTFIEGCSIACIAPRKDGLAALFIDPEERSRVNGILFMISIGFTAPLSVLIGQLSEMNRVYPFYLNIVNVALILFCVLTSKEIVALDKKNAVTK